MQVWLNSFGSPRILWAGFSTLHNYWLPYHPEIKLEMPTDVTASKSTHEGVFSVKTASEWPISFADEFDFSLPPIAVGYLHAIGTAGDRRPSACGAGSIVARHLAAHGLSFKLDRFLPASVLLGKTLM
jgi:hypothetical protein